MANRRIILILVINVSSEYLVSGLCLKEYIVILSN